MGGGRGERSGGGGGGLGGRGWGGRGGCERRTEVFVKIQKKNIFFWGGGIGLGGGGVRVDVNQELKFFGKIGGGEGGSMGGPGWGIRMDVNEELKFL